MIIRPFQPEDAVHLGRIFYQSVHEIGARHYTPAQVQAWAPAEPSADSYMGRAADGRIFLVALTDDGAPVAYADLQSDGRIDHLYCAPEAAGTGVAAGLYEHLQHRALKQRMGRLYVDASEGARRFFAKHGFATLQRRDFTLRGVAIHNYAMDKYLDADTA